MTIQISMPMFGQEPKISIEKIENSFRSTWGKDHLFLDKNSDEIVFSFVYFGASVVIGIMNAPIPWGDLEEPCTASILWPNAKQELSGHTHHVIVTVSSDNLTSMEIASLLTKITASVMDSTEGALGVFWNNSLMVIPKDIFIRFSNEILPKEPPTYIWVDIRSGIVEGNKTSAFTTGLAALGLMDIEATNTPETVPQLREWLYSLADYLIDKGLVIKDGDTVGKDKNILVRAVYEKSTFGKSETIIRLIYCPEKTKKSVFKFWQR